MIIDLHSHRLPPPPFAVGAVSVIDSAQCEILLEHPELCFSAGIHPWDTDREISGEEWRRLELMAALPQTVAIGEAGIDRLRGGALFRQMLVLRRQVELSEKLGLPLILHDVKAHDIIAGLRRELKPRQPWVIHGFRAKPSVARMMTACGCALSFGPLFNADTLREVPPPLIFAETDESPLPIAEVVARMSEARGEDMEPIVAANTARLLGRESSGVSDSR